MGDGSIVSGIPKNVKPAPAVVAIKMAELLTVPENDIDLNVKEVDPAVISEESGQNKSDMKKQKMLEKQKQDEKIKQEKGLKDKDKLKREEAVIHNKEQEKLAK